MKTLFLILVLSSTYLCSQNLVPNPSFEEYDEELFYWYPENTDTFTFNAVSYPPLHWVDAFRSPNYLTPIDDSIRTFFLILELRAIKIITYQLEQVVIILC